MHCKTNHAAGGKPATAQPVFVAPFAPVCRVPFAVLFPLILLLLAGGITTLTLHTDSAMIAFNRTSIPPNTIQGIPEPRFFLETDSYVWLSHTRDMLRAGAVRIRHTFMDNAPYGREMHWSHLLIWTLAGLTHGIAAATGWPLMRSLELAGVWVMPLFQFFFLALAIAVLLRKTGILPALAFLAAALGFDCLSIAFFPLKPDHHAFQLFFGTAVLVCLQLGGMGFVGNNGGDDGSRALRWARLPNLPALPEARCWFMASGVFGGLMLWVGATVGWVVLCAIALAALPAMPCFRTGGHARGTPNAPPPITARPELWRIWVVAGIITAALGWLLEYAPNFFAMRLEVNHPLYWLSWLGIALGLERCWRLSAPFRPAALFRSPVLWLAAALALSLPLTILFGTDAWHQMQDPFLRRLHAAYIDEFKPISITPLSLLVTFRVFILAIPWGIAVLWTNRHASSPVAEVIRLSLLAPALIFTLLFFAFACIQQRWGFLLGAGSAWLTLLLLTHAFTAPGVGRRLAWAATALILLDSGWSLAERLRAESHIATASMLPDNWIRNNLEKRQALRLGMAMGTNHWRVAGLPTLAPTLYYFAEIPSIASYYWENAAGWHAEAALMADTSPDATNARAIVRERGLTHLLSIASSAYPLLFSDVATGSTNHLYAARHSLCGHLTHAPFLLCPTWLQLHTSLTADVQGPFLFQTPSGPARESTRHHVFAVLPPPLETHP